MRRYIGPVDPYCRQSFVHDLADRGAQQPLRHLSVLADEQRFARLQIPICDIIREQFDDAVRQSHRFDLLMSSLTLNIQDRDAIFRAVEIFYVDPFDLAGTKRQQQHQCDHQFVAPALPGRHVDRIQQACSIGSNKPSLAMPFVTHRGTYTIADAVIVPALLAVFIEQPHRRHVAVDSQRRFPLYFQILFVAEQIDAARHPRIAPSAMQPAEP